MWSSQCVSKFESIIIDLESGEYEGRALGYNNQRLAVYFNIALAITKSLLFWEILDASLADLR